MQIEDKVFIEDQFPVSKISKESFKERKANLGQTLTGLGKWWGRKPLILIRASIIGMLMPVSMDSKKDRDIFLKILTMDDEGLWFRRSKSIPMKKIFEILSSIDKERFFVRSTKGNISWKPRTDNKEKERLTKHYFNSLSYDDKLPFCDRPEQISGPNKDTWKEINVHLGTHATNLQELVQQLGKTRFGHLPKIGDPFSGGGSIPFEAARLGCQTYGSDLNPVGALLTWASVNLIGGGKEVQNHMQNVLQTAYEKADKQIGEWEIEHNEKGWRADAYIYCSEVICPATGLLVPLAPNWVISEKHKVCAVLKRNETNMNYDIDIVTAADKETYAKAKIGTVQNSRLICPDTGETFPISSIRGDRKDSNGMTIYGLRLWEKGDVIPKPNDVFQERLYCVRWSETYQLDGKEKTRQHYCSVTKGDIKREEKVYNLLKERLQEWQKNGYIPSKKIERGGLKTEEPIRNRGWAYWHHLFNPRQLLINGLLFSYAAKNTQEEFAISFLAISKVVDWNSKLCAWMHHFGNQKGNQVFVNQALNTLYNYSVRPLLKLKGTWTKLLSQ